MIRISFIAPSCYGKSTAISILSKYYRIKNIKIATPLYEMQQSFYSRLNIDIGDKQDGELLQFLGNKIRKEKPLYLIEKFTSQLMNIDDVDIVTNDDCRPPDYDYLRKLDFKFITINGFKRDRNDYAEANVKSNLEWQNNSLEYDYQLNNYGTLAEYEENIINLMKEIKKNDHVKTIRKK